MLLTPLLPRFDLACGERGRAAAADDEQSATRRRHPPRPGRRAAVAADDATLITARVNFAPRSLSRSAAKIGEFAE